MTPLPKRRWSTRRQGKHRASLRPKTLTAGKCVNCGGPTINHAACQVCGYYGKIQVLKVKEAKSVENRV